MSTDTTLVWNLTNYQPLGVGAAVPVVQQAPSNAATVAQLRGSDYFSENEDFIDWCNTNYAIGAGNQWVIVNVTEAVLQPSSVQFHATITHSLRKSDIKLFNVLTYSYQLPLKPVLSITGAPRIGKSTCVFAWLLCQQNHPFLWVHREKGENYILLDWRPGSAGIAPAGQLRSCAVYTEADLLTELRLNVPAYHIVCFDGYFEDVADVIGIAHKTGRFVIMCSSMQVIGFPESFTARHEILRYTSDSWTLEEYTTMNNSGLLASTNGNVNLTDQQMKERFYYGGGCLKWFQEPRKSRVMDFIDTHLQRIVNLTMGINLLTIGRSSELAVNSLLSNYQNKTCIVSGYALEQLSKTADLHGIEVLRSMYRDNPRFQGTVTQFDVETRLRICARANAESTTQTETFNVVGLGWFGEQRTTKFRVLQVVDYDRLTDMADGLTSNYVYIPRDDLNPVFDFVYFEIKNGIPHVYFANVSDAGRHDFNYTKCRDFMQHFYGAAPDPPPPGPRILPGWMSEHTPYHVHFYYLTNRRNFNTARVGTETSKNLLQQYDRKWKGVKVKYSAY